MTNYEEFRRQSKIAGQVLVSTDTETIAQWAKECLEQRLFEPDLVCQHVFAGEAEITLMAYLPRIAWVVYHGWPARFGKPKDCASIWVHPDHRHQGIGRTIGLMAWGAHKAIGF